MLSRIIWPSLRWVTWMQQFIRYDLNLMLSYVLMRCSFMGSCCLCRFCHPGHSSELSWLPFTSRLKVFFGSQTKRCRDPGIWTPEGVAPGRWLRSTIDLVHSLSCIISNSGFGWNHFGTSSSDLLRSSEESVNWGCPHCRRGGSWWRSPPPLFSDGCSQGFLYMLMFLLLLREHFLLNVVESWSSQVCVPVNGGSQREGVLICVHLKSWEAHKCMG